MSHSEVPCITYMALYILSFHILQSNSRTSTFWKLNQEEGKIIEASNNHFSNNIINTIRSGSSSSGGGGGDDHHAGLDLVDDPIFNIITSTVVHYGKTWTKRGIDDKNNNYYCTDCDTITNNGTTNNDPNIQPSVTDKIITFSGTDGIKDDKMKSGLPNQQQRQDADSGGGAITTNDNIGSSSGQMNSASSINSDNRNSTNVNASEDNEVLDCGKTVNFTYYDNLVGIANRMTHPNVPEPTVALIFKKRGAEFDVEALERRLMKAKREKPKSVQLYNQIGNFFRIKGDTYKSIECFRRALAVSPHNAEVLLNLARVLFNLQYLDDAIYLTRRSLEVQPPDKSAWMQYFTLGEIFKAYGHYQEASLHLRHCLELRPEFEPALALLRDMEAMPDNTIHVYTLLIIICLVLGVLLVIVSSVDANLETDFPEVVKTHRHFNRAMAMRSLKMGVSPRSMRQGNGGNSGGGKRYNNNSNGGNN